jgi:hypothetical protein
MLQEALLVCIQRVLLQKIWKEGDRREAFFLASFTLPLKTVYWLLGISVLKEGS